MLINDNGVTREMTEEEIAEHNKPKPAPSDLGDLTVDDTLAMLNELGVDVNDQS